MDIESKQLDIYTGVPLAPKTTLGVGGPAAYFCVPDGFQQLLEALAFAQKEKLQTLILGRGSNLLVSDNGFEGLVIQLSKFDRILRRFDGRLWADAGVSVAELVNFGEIKGYSGFEEFAGLPGTVGGAIYGNAGCHGKEFWQILETIRYFDGKGIVEIPAAKIQPPNQLYGYRWSIFKDNSWIVISAALKFENKEVGEVKKLTDKFRQRRKSNEPKAKSAGCIFRNPFVDGQYVSAGELIDKCGLKGLRLGQAQVSEKHGNFFINLGGATALAFRDLIEVVKERVFKKTDRVLEEEIIKIGKL